MSLIYEPILVPNLYFGWEKWLATSAFSWGLEFQGATRPLFLLHLLDLYWLIFLVVPYLNRFLAPLTFHVYLNALHLNNKVLFSQINQMKVLGKAFQANKMSS